MTRTHNNFLGYNIRQHKRIPNDITSVTVLPGGTKWVIDQQTGKLYAE